jgi:hypothetical protein
VSNANAGSSCFVARFSIWPARLALRHVLAASRLRALSAAAAGLIAGLVMSGCGTQATLHLTAPANVVAGSPFTVTVTATVNGKPDTVINSPIKFTSSDPVAVLPPIFYFSAADAGSFTFTNEFILMTPGSQSITVTVIGASGLNAIANVEVAVATTAQRR